MSATPLPPDTESNLPRATVQALREAVAVRQITEVTPGHFRLRLESSNIAAHARAGQFVHILCRQPDATDPLLRRAFSVATVEAGSFDILFRVEGKGTRWLSQVRPGETLDVLGPLGLPFDTSLLQGSGKTAVLVGGGVGVPPMMMLAAQVSRETSACRIEAIIGARSADGLIGEAELQRLTAATTVVTEDGSAGHTGRVTLPLEEMLLNRSGQHKSMAVFACGPLPMLRAVAALCSQYSVNCQVSLEENMPCGIGICNGCVVRALPPSADSSASATASATASAYDLYRRICVEGPVVDARQIDWEATR